MQVRRVDPDTGEDYWTLLPEDMPLGVAVPKTGGGSVVTAVMILLSVAVLAGVLMVIRRDGKIYQIKH